MDLQEVGGGRGDWMELAQDRDWWRALVGTRLGLWIGSLFLRFWDKVCVPH